MWLQNSEKIRNPVRLRLQHGEGGGGHRRLKAEAEEDNLAVRVFARELQARRAANRPCGYRRRRLWPATGSCASRARAWRRRRWRRSRPASRPARRNHRRGPSAARRRGSPAHAPTRSSGGSMLADAIFEDRMGVAAAHFHDLQRAARARRRYPPSAPRSRAAAYWLCSGSRNSSTYFI